MKFIWKRALALTLALFTVLSLAACGKQSAEPAAGGTAQVQTPPESPTPDAPAAPSDAAPGSPSAGPPAQSAPEAPPSDAPAESPPAENTPDPQPLTVSEDGWYSSKDEVALYLYLYGRLPDNYITKREAEDLGWTGGSVERWAGEGMAIGGGRFGNYEGLLPDAPGRTYAECDIDTVGTSSRGAKRIVFSNDGLIYYTEDHYESFELLYGEP